MAGTIDYKKHIESNPSVMLGKPVIKGTRLTVEMILQKLSEGASAEQLIVAYPSLQINDILAVLAYASDIISTETILSMHDFS